MSIKAVLTTSIGEFWGRPDGLAGKPTPRATHRLRHRFQQPSLLEATCSALEGRFWTSICKKYTNCYNVLCGRTALCAPETALPSVDCAFSAPAHGNQEIFHMTTRLDQLSINLPHERLFLVCDGGFGSDPSDGLNWESCNRPRTSFWRARSAATAGSPHGYAPLESFATA